FAPARSRSDVATKASRPQPSRLCQARTSAGLKPQPPSPLVPPSPRCGDTRRMNRNRRPSLPGACEIVTLRMELLHVEPLIWRQLEVPTMMTLGALHEIIQAAMCWSDSHLWEFAVDGRRYGMPDGDDLGDE